MWNGDQGKVCAFDYQSGKSHGIVRGGFWFTYWVWTLSIALIYVLVYPEGVGKIYLVNNYQSDMKFERSWCILNHQIVHYYLSSASYACKFYFQGACLFYNGVCLWRWSHDAYTFWCVFWAKDSVSFRRFLPSGTGQLHGFFQMHWGGGCLFKLE